MTAYLVVRFNAVGPLSASPLKVNAFPTEYLNPPLATLANGGSNGHSEYDPGVAGQRASNAGRKLGAKPAFKPQQVWAIRFWLDHQIGYGIGRCSILPSTASCAAATS